MPVPEFRLTITRHDPGTTPAVGIATVAFDNGHVLSVLMLRRGQRVEAVCPTVRLGNGVQYRSWDVPWWDELRTAVEAAWHACQDRGGVAMD